MTPDRLRELEDIQNANCPCVECAGIRELVAEVRRLTADAAMSEDCLAMIAGFLKDVGCECEAKAHDATPPMMFPEWIACAMRAYANLENARLRAVIAQHELCHDLHGKVNATDFAAGCEAEQRRIYGCAPDADEVARLRVRVAELEAAKPIAESLLTNWYYTYGCTGEGLSPDCLADIRSLAAAVRGPTPTESCPPKAEGT